MVLMCTSLAGSVRGKKAPRVVLRANERLEAVVRDAAVIGNGEPSPPFEQMGSALPRLWPAPQSKPYGFSSDLVVTASDQRVDAVPLRL